MFDLTWQKLIYDIKLILLKHYKELYNNNWIQTEWETYIHIHKRWDHTGQDDW